MPQAGADVAHLQLLKKVTILSIPAEVKVARPLVALKAWLDSMLSRLASYVDLLPVYFRKMLAASITFDLEAAVYSQNIQKSCGQGRHGLASRKVA